MVGLAAVATLLFSAAARAQGVFDPESTKTPSFQLVPVFSGATPDGGDNACVANGGLTDNENGNCDSFFVDFELLTLDDGSGTVCTFDNPDSAFTCGSDSNDSTLHAFFNAIKVDKFGEILATDLDIHNNKNVHFFSTDFGPSGNAEFFYNSDKTYKFVLKTVLV